MHQRLDCLKPTRVNLELVLRDWRWFRAQVERIHGMPGLPESFTESDGEVQVIERLDEDDPSYDFRPAEFNYSSTSQTIRVQRGPQRVEIHVYYSDLGAHYSFDYNDAHTGVRLFAARHACYLELDDDSPHFAAWQAARLDVGGS